MYDTNSCWQPLDAAKAVDTLGLISFLPLDVIIMVFNASLRVVSLTPSHTYKTKIRSPLNRATSVDTHFRPFKFSKPVGMLKYASNSLTISFYKLPQSFQSARGNERSTTTQRTPTSSLPGGSWVATTLPSQRRATLQLDLGDPANPGRLLPFPLPLPNRTDPWVKNQGQGFTAYPVEFVVSLSSSRCLATHHIS